MNVTEYWVTTTDNPFDPFTEYDEWYRFDEQKGYHTSSYVARDPEVMYLPSDAPPLVVQRAIKSAVDTICQFNLTCVEGVSYKRVTRVVDSDVEYKIVE